MKQYVKIYCCGDCIQYNWKKHKCNLGAHEEGKPFDSFYQDCPIGLHEENEILPSAAPERTAKVIDKSADRHSIIDFDWVGKCEKCGNEIQYAFDYCPYCGSKLDWSENE